MEKSLTLRSYWLRFWSFLAGLGMAVFSYLTIDHFFQANFPETIFTGAFCDISAFFNCDSSAYSSIAHFQGVPLGYWGLVLGILVMIGAVLPSVRLERVNKLLALLNALGVVSLFVYSVFFLKSLCLLCSGFYVFSLLNFFLFWKYGVRNDYPGLYGFFQNLVFGSIKPLLVIGVVTLMGAYGFHLFYQAKKDAQLGGVATKIVKEFYSLETVKNPSLISPYWTARATENFEDAPIRIVEYGDFLCSDCLFLFKQLERIKKEYAGKINIAFQFFPLEAKCNDVVDKDKHPGSCELSYIAAYDPAKFAQIHDEIFRNFEKAKNPEWRLQLARKYGVEAALNDEKTKELVRQIIETGKEYEKTSDRFPYGIRSTPTIIINNRMIIGTLPYAHLKAIIESLLTEQEKPAAGESKFLENWVDTRKLKK
ncbi:MAG: thioredoxin domain-containing protein [Candidatus Saccharicenans sp.]|uniref:thioredoxin domain-containing protein n=1 Tax=Candidatus Saccharicenans sp. TaxID=2819258 RepID=UPI004049F742